MSGFLTRLALRALDATPSIRPRLSNRFETERGRNEDPFHESARQDHGFAEHSHPSPLPQPEASPTVSRTGSSPFHPSVRRPVSDPAPPWTPRTTSTHAPSRTDMPTGEFEVPLSASPDSVASTSDSRSPRDPEPRFSNHQTALLAVPHPQHAPSPSSLTRSDVPQDRGLSTIPAHHRPPTVSAAPRLPVPESSPSAANPSVAGRSVEATLRSGLPAASASLSESASIRIEPPSVAEHAPRPTHDSNEPPVPPVPRFQPQFVRVHQGPQSLDPSRDASAPLKSRDHLPPDIHINIGRVEIRASMPPADRTPKSQPTPRMSLDAILKKSAPAP